MSTGKKQPKAATDKARARWLEKARTLSEALPFMRAHAGRTFVVKFGGHAMGDPELAALFARDIVLLKQVGINPIVVHGGGPQIGNMLERLRIKSSFIEGLRVTDAETVEVVEMVLSGSINKQIVTAINEAGGTAVGLSGKDGNLIQARKLRRTRRDPDSNIEKVLDLGFVGEPSKINATVIHELGKANVIPVIAPLGIGPKGMTYNINADTAAGAVAAALNAERLLMLTDVAGVLDKQGQLIPEMTATKVRTAIRNGTISGGMIPKVETCLDAVNGGVEAAVILDGRVPHALILEVFTEHGVGTLIRRNVKSRARKKS
jgi:acetylglutamate kinase